MFYQVREGGGVQKVQKERGRKTEHEGGRVQICYRERGCRTQSQVILYCASNFKKQKRSLLPGNKLRTGDVDCELCKSIMRFAFCVKVGQIYFIRSLKSTVKEYWVT